MQPIQDILLHLDPGAPPEPRLALAIPLARRLGAHLIGLCVLDLAWPAAVDGDVAGGSAMVQVLAQMQAEAEARARRLATLFEAALERAGVAGEWRQVEGHTGAQVALHGRHADLVILGQPDPGNPGAAPAAAAEAALFDTGRPALVVPFAGRFDRPGRRPLLAWNASREAARAVHDALPLLAGAEAVSVLIVDAPADASDLGAEPGADIARHLARHGLPVVVRRVAGAGLPVGEVLLNAAADLGADLIVMGAYGHSRLRELILGGVTRTLLRQMTVPVLLAH